MLPIAFENRMREMLQEEYAAFEAGYEKDKYQALRFNPLKGNISSFLERKLFHLTKLPWEENGYYYETQDAPGKHPYHEAGVYYIQEPSAQAVVPFLEVQPGERVLDLCAAPGGKSTQIAAALRGEGLLLCNEIHPARAKILSENIERMGVRNAIVTNEEPAKLAELFVEYFDKILVDAPCSGEGMFRKNEEAKQEWSPQNVQNCAMRQDEILDCAARMLRPGGRLVYSTCTFAPAENEGSIARFLERQEGFEVVETKIPEGFEPGRPQWSANVEGAYLLPCNPQMAHTLRLWPHKIHGEGHFLAVLKKAKDNRGESKVLPRFGLEQGMKEKECGELMQFWRETVKEPLCGVLLKFGEQVYLGPEEMPSLQRLRVLRPGLHLGTLKKNRFEPSHALALVLRADQVTDSYDLSSTDGSAAAFIAGGTFPVEEKKGWCLITVDGYSLGWGKAAGGIMKNHYPKGLRKF